MDRDPNFQGSGKHLPYIPPALRVGLQQTGRGSGGDRGQDKGRGSRGGERGAMGMESLSMFSDRRQNFGDWRRGRESSGDREGWRQRNFDNRNGRDRGQDSGGQDGWRHNSSNHSGENRCFGVRGGRRETFTPRGGSLQTQDSSDSRNGDGDGSHFHNSRNRRRERPISNRELENLTTLQPYLVIYYLLIDKSGFPLFIEDWSFTPYEMDLTVKVLARATATQSNREIMYEFLNKTCTENFVAKLMDYALTVKRDYPEKGPVFFAELLTILETFSNAMITIAIKRLLNLVDGCHGVLISMEAAGHVGDRLGNKYKVLLDFLTEEKKRFAEEEKMDSKARKRRMVAAMDNMEPPDNFREMSVLPTSMDIADTSRPFLRKNVVSGRYTDGHHYLDVQFRLLREDFVRPLRVGISQFRNNVKSRITDVRIYRNVRYLGCRLDRRRIFHEVQLGSLKKMKLENSKRLMYGNLVCLSNDNFATMMLGSVADRTPEKFKDDIIGLEFESDISDFDLSSQFTMIESRAYFVAYKHVLHALKEMPNNIPMETYVVHVTALIDPPQYTDKDDVYDLRLVKKSTMMRKNEATMSLFRLPIRCRIVLEKQEEDDVDEGPEFKHLQALQVFRALPHWPSEAELGLDSSQRRALRSALTRELAIIQGPPGTGKTFIGLKIVEILLNNSKVWKTEENPTPILVVCFTNHALDQFLEGMTTFTNSIVRVGSRTQSEKIAGFQINQLVRGVVSSRALPQNIHSTKVDITIEIKDLKEQVRDCQEIDSACDAARGIFHPSVFSKNIIPEDILQQLLQSPHERKIAHWLTHNYHTQGNAGLPLQQPTNTTGQRQQQQQQKQQQQQAPGTENGDSDEDAFQDAEEFIETEERERKLDDDTEEPVLERVEKVYYEVTKNQLAEALKTLEYDYAEALQKGHDDATIYFNHRMISGQLDAITFGLVIDVNEQDMQALEAHPQLNIWHLEPRMRWQLYNYWVAKLQRSVRARRTILSAELTKKVKTYEGISNAEYLYTMRRAAIVGMTTTGAAQYNSILRDLAPVIVVIEEAAEILESHVITSLTAGCQHLIMIGDHQQLQPSATVYELATKFGLETSLFERMINNGLAYETLEYQHRMRPEISRLLVPSIYPTLKDHPSVNEYPRVLGMAHNVFFLTHQEHEREASDDNNSHENQHEGELIMGLCRHLVLQGYKPDEITFLTTYSGQFFLLRRLQRLHPECTGVRIAMVDNFQGEENKIILLSLVRSNPDGKVGSLRTDNRVCVALSRAKHGLYITGNMDLLRDSSSLWKKIHEDLSQSGSLGPAFILRCENHPHQLVPVATGEDFHAKSPEGGCLQVCGKPLPRCRHSCPRVCHLNDPEHEEYKCWVPCPKTLCSLDHKCPKLCHQECGPCMVILPKFLPCGHTHNIECHVAPKSYNCPTNVKKTIPACDHEVTMPCHQDPKTFTCPMDCDTRMYCGHKCKKKCHRTEDPDHLNYQCTENCTKINVGCTQQHLCLKKCYQECGSCVVLVNKKLPCGHEHKDVECSQPAEEIKCKEPCNTHPCGHKCKKLCYHKCRDCEVPVKKTVPACGHTITTACSKPATTHQCSGQCPKQLRCGHPCQEKCRDQCTADCPELVVSANKCPKGHAIKLPCHLRTKVVGEAAWGYCTAPCDKTLDCEHQCVGTCGRCLHGRLHLYCNKPCDRQLVCGHICKYLCSAPCPPCQKECQWKCVHSKCRQMCGRPCQPCQEKCEMSCKHKTCKKKCGEECEWRSRHEKCKDKCGGDCQWQCKHDTCKRKCGEYCEWQCKHNTDAEECGKDCYRKPCAEPCPKTLDKCGHACVGFCGDPCPPLCRECDKEELTELVLMGNEDEPDARFVLLEDCGHCIEVEGLEMWLQKEDTEVGMKTCPKCSSAIYNNRRYQNIVLQAYKPVLGVKNKYYEAQKIIKMRDIELILQDRDIHTCFKSECFMLLEKIGAGPQENKKPFDSLSVGEQTLYYFQAQVLKKATSILNQQQTTEDRPYLSLPFTKPPTYSRLKHLPVLKPMVKAVMALVMEKTTSITPQMECEVSCELQRLAVLPAYWTFLEKSAVPQNRYMRTLKAKVEVLMDPTVKFDEVLDEKVRALLKESEQYVGRLGISSQENIKIIQAMGLEQGHWYKCRNGHIYGITNSQRATVGSTCPDCGSRIVCGSDGLMSENSVATEMDRARNGAWSEQNNRLYKLPPQSPPPSQQ